MTEQTPTPIIRMRCTDENAAQLCHTWLLSEGVRDVEQDGHDVLVPTSYPPFVWDLAEALVRHGFAHDADAARSATEFLAGVGRA